MDFLRYIKHLQCVILTFKTIFLTGYIMKLQNMKILKMQGAGGGLSLVVSWVWKIPKLHASCC